MGLDDQARLSGRPVSASSVLGLKAWATKAARLYGCQGFKPGHLLKAFTGRAISSAPWRPLNFSHPHDFIMADSYIYIIVLRPRLPRDFIVVALFVFSQVFTFVIIAKNKIVVIICV